MSGSAPSSLFPLIFMWTPPHFWALALYRSGDYARAGVPMLPVVAGDGARPSGRCWSIRVLLVPLALAPWLARPGRLGLWRGGGACSAALHRWRGRGVRRDSDQRAPQRLFAFSILYLFLLFAL